jgi:hypothetical protein
MLRRKKLGTTYTKSPADNVKSWGMINLGKIFFAIFTSITSLLLLLLGFAIVGFLGTEVATVWEPNEFNTMKEYRGPLGIILQVITVIGVILFVFRDAHKVKQ